MSKIKSQNHSKLSKKFLREDTVENLQSSMEAMEDLCNDYFEIQGMANPQELDKLKVTLLSYYGTYSYYMAEVYSKKGPTRIYLEELRKQVKQEHIEYLMENPPIIEGKYSLTRAEKDVENHTEYIEDLLAIDRFKEILITFEQRDKFFLMVISAITQSISIHKKEYEANQYS
ncbi:MAG: hypothetical protein ACRCVU_04880 [Flavobacterium sp.]